MSGRVALIGEPRLERLFGGIVAGLQRAGVTVARFHSAEAALAEPCHADAVLAMSHIRCGAALLDAFPATRLLASPVIGTEGFDIGAASERGVAIANAHTPDTVESMAEATIMLALAALYDLKRAEQQLRENAPDAPAFARMLKGRTVGLLGYGAIARAVCERLAGWKCDVLVFARRPQSDLPGYARQAPLDEVIGRSDLLVPLLALNAETRHVLDAARLRALKPGAVLLNTGRGELIDEAALIALLRERTDVRVALDTFEVLPLPADSPLREVAGAILTPHRVGHTLDALSALQAASVDNVTAVLRGELPPGLRNPKIADDWLQRWRTTA